MYDLNQLIYGSKTKQPVFDLECRNYLISNPKDKYTFIIAVCKKQLKFKKGNYAAIYPFLKDAKYYQNVYSAYKQCFIGLRLTNHDGNANSVQECEAMDIPVIHNQSDYGLKWGNIDDIIRHIKNVSTV